MFYQRPVKNTFVVGSRRVPRNDRHNKNLEVPYPRMMERMDALLQHLVPGTNEDEGKSLVGFGQRSIAFGGRALRGFLENQGHIGAILERDLKD